jgi:hypothetical protein
MCLEYKRRADFFNCLVWMPQGPAVGQTVPREASKPIILNPNTAQYQGRNIHDSSIDDAAAAGGAAAATSK